LQTARIAAVRRAHPALVLIAAGLALAAAAAGYMLHATMAPLVPATTAGASIIGPDAASRPAESDAKIRDTIVWRDEAGAVYRAKVGDGRLDQFLRRRKATLETARSESRDQVAAEILTALKPVFADMKERVPGYADWYFRYLTRYELMSRAILPAIEYLGRNLYFLSPPEKNLIQTVGPYVVAYLDQQYAERVVRPREAEIRGLDIAIRSRAAREISGDVYEFFEQGDEGIRRQVLANFRNVRRGWDDQGGLHSTGGIASCASQNNAIYNRQIGRSKHVNGHAVCPFTKPGSDSAHFQPFYAWPGIAAAP
jgi:hypothetical protein